LEFLGDDCRSRRASGLPRPCPCLRSSSAPGMALCA
jgi:hypothetical protein